MMMKEHITGNIDIIFQILPDEYNVYKRDGKKHIAKRRFALSDRKRAAIYFNMLIAEQKGK